jgi:outer membrane protein OmpA-like peptidoglycan-associated protein
MKKIIFLLSIGLCLMCFTPAEGQKLLKKVSMKAREKVDRAKDRSNDKVNDGIDDAVDKGFEELGNFFEGDGGNKDDADAEPGEAEQMAEESQGKEEQIVWSKYNFVPGDSVIFEDSQEHEENGEFPSKWDLKTGNVEIALLDEQTIINFPSTNPAEIVPLMKEKGDYLPEIFTLEFDAFFSEFCTSYTIYLYDRINQASIKPGYVTVRGNSFILAGKGAEDIRENENYPYWARVAVSFNKRALKVFLDEQRIANIPNLSINPSGISIRSDQCHEGMISALKNVRIATGRIKLYDRVVTDGKFVTNGIRFDSGKATLRPESMGVINEIQKMLSAHPDLNFSIEGHTDSDGDETANVSLSEERARAVKVALVEAGISADRLSTKGLGESQPVDNNATPEGKANNRRVEFVKI